jgi:hypothetical protein
MVHGLAHHLDSVASSASSSQSSIAAERNEAALHKFPAASMTHPKTPEITTFSIGFRNAAVS